MCAGDLPRDGEPKSTTGFITVRTCARCFGTEETVENVRLRLVRDPRARIDHPNRALLAGPRHLHPDHAATRRVLDRVVEQVRDQAVEQQWIPRARRLGVWCELDAHTALLCERP